LLKTTNKDHLVESILSLADRLFRQLLPTVPEELLTLDATLPQLKIMLMLYFRGSMRMSDIASELNVTLPTATNLVDRLVEKDFITREAQFDDRRVVLCKLSTQGQKAIVSIWESAALRCRILLKSMDQEKLESFVDVMGDMLNSAPVLEEQAAVLLKQYRKEKLVV
jgi:DNA-binding MarR family transcriptional regulator